MHATLLGRSGAARMMQLLLAALVGTLLLLPAVRAAPQVATTRFSRPPQKLFYFDDSEVVLLYDANGAIYRSKNEGKDWELQKQLQDAVLLVEHPYDKQMAFVVGKGRKHFVTHDRGNTWKSFETEHEATRLGRVFTFHATNPDWVIFQATHCPSFLQCVDVAYYTTDAFRSDAIKMLDNVAECKFARATKIIDAPERQVLCVAFPDGDSKSVEARLYQSQDWFETKEYVDLGIGKQARGVAGMGIVSKFIVVAVRSANAGLAKRAGNDPMQLYVSTDGKKWRQARFPHSVLPDLVENAYTIVDSTTHSLAVDVLQSNKGVGTMFVSSSDGTYFVQSLPDSNRDKNGIVDFEPIQSVEGVGIANTVLNKDEVIMFDEPKKLFSWLTYDDGSSWTNLLPPPKKLDGSSWDCDLSQPASCSLHLHSVSEHRNIGRVFSSTAPGFVMGVGSVGQFLLPYDECDTFLSTDAGLTWTMVQEGAYMYEFGDQGSVLVIVDDEEVTDKVRYSYDGGKTWDDLDIGIKVRALALTTVPDSTSQKFILVAQALRGDAKEGRYVTFFLDFAGAQPRQCKAGDFENWYARDTQDGQCLMGHKQWYKRRKLDAKCYVGNKFEDPVNHEENCKCTKNDFECDFNFVRQLDKCVAAGPEYVPPGVCANPTDTYMGSSGYRKIPGNTCEGGVQLDEKVKKKCSDARPEDGQASHAITEFESKIIRHNYFHKSKSILVHLADGTVWLSRNEGFSWSNLEKGKQFLAVMMHPYDSDRAYLLTGDRTTYYTTDRGASWNTMTMPEDPNSLGISLLSFHPTKADWLIYTGSVDCGTLSPNCRAVAYYSEDHGRRWTKIDDYVRNCQWGKDTKLDLDDRVIICEAYAKKEGSQATPSDNPLRLIIGHNFYRKREAAFDSIVGWTTFSQYMLVAEYVDRSSLALHVSLNARDWAEAQFPQGLQIGDRAYTILESNTDEVFLHMTMNAKRGSEWGSLFKSNSNGTYYSLSLEHVNRNSQGYVDFEKMIGLDGIAMVNIVANPDQADISGNKKLQTRITHNDGGRWKPMNAPAKDSLGQPYDCDTTSCSLQIHGYTERRDPRATYSSPSAIGLMLAVGNVGEELAPYEDSDIFLTRDGGFTWEEVHKDAHMWEYGDSGTIIVLVYDEGPTDHVLYTLDQGLTWKTYSFGEQLRVSTIQTVPEDTSRRFFLIGQRPTDKNRSLIVHLDFSKVQTVKCKLDLDNPNDDDFELWSPSEDREEQCLFGAQTLYHRRIRDRDCYIGEEVPQNRKVVKTCKCTMADFECEFNYYRNDKGECVLVDGATPLAVSPETEQCVGLESTWYERTAYRKVPYSKCEGGERPDRGKAHACPGLVGGGLGFMFWASVIILPFACAALGGWWWLSKGQRRGVIRLDEHRAYHGQTTATVLATLASVPYFLLGVVSAAWSELQRRVPALENLGGRRRSAYRAVPVDDDAELLGEYEDD